MSLIAVWGRPVAQICRTISAFSCCSFVSGVLSDGPVMPMMRFIGVRISWLITPGGGGLRLGRGLGLHGGLVEHTVPFPQLRERR